MSTATFRRALAGAMFAAFVMPQAASAEVATFKSGTKLIGPGETAEFPITSSKTQSSDFQASCDVEAGGRASVTFDGEHYIPLSDPAVGEIIALSPGEKRHYDLTGSIEANKGDAYIAFAFTGVPQAMCFPGEQCDGASGGAQKVKVTCSGS